MKEDVNYIKYNTAVLGGTFDLLHDGHKAFVRYAFSVAQRCVIGLTSDVYVSKIKGSFTIESYKRRYTMLYAFLEKEGFIKRAEIVSIDDLYGSTCDPAMKFDVLVVSSETERGGELVNIKRKERGLLPLPLLHSPDVYAEDGIIISSTRIRKGDIDTEGKLFFKKEWENKTFVLPQELRSELAKPFGQVFPQENIKHIVLPGYPNVTVGDVTTMLFNANNIQQEISVIDFVIERKKQPKALDKLGFKGVKTILHAENPPSKVTASLTSAIKRTISLLDISTKTVSSNRIIILIKGEEDLAVLPLILLLPLGWRIYYGQPHEGIVEVIVTIFLKIEARNLLARFQIITRGY